MKTKTRLALLLLLGTLGIGMVGPRGLAAQVVPLGPEIDLGADTFPKTPSLAVQPDGSYLVAWDEGYDSHQGIFYRYVAAGTTPGNAWPSTIEYEDRYPFIDTVTAAAKGFDVLWHEPANGGKPIAFYRQHLTLQGAPDGDAIRLGGPGTEWVWHVRGNGFVAGWKLPRKHGIAAQRLGTKGERVGPELRLNSRPIDNPQPFVMAVADGGFVAVWLGTVPGTAQAVLRARRFSSAGKPLGPDFDVNTIPLGTVGTPPYVDPGFEVAAAPGGRFAVAWLRADKIYLRFFNPLGVALGTEVPVVTLKEPEFEGPESMAFDNSGNLLLLWRADAELADLRLQLFNPRGVALGPAIGVRSEASDIFDAPWGGKVIWTGSSWLVAWGAAGASSYDFSTIFVRRFGRTQ